jgi:hypothetical protein
MGHSLAFPTFDNPYPKPTRVYDLLKALGGGPERRNTYVRRKEGKVLARVVGMRA